MLQVSKEDNIIKVIETIPTWTMTDVNVVFYDMENKRKKVNNDPWYPMSKSCIEWVEKYYLPKVEQ